MLSCWQQVVVVAQGRAGSGAGQLEDAVACGCRPWSLAFVSKILGVVKPYNNSVQAWDTLLSPSTLSPFLSLRRSVSTGSYFYRERSSWRKRRARGKRNGLPVRLSATWQCCVFFDKQQFVHRVTVDSANGRRKVWCVLCSLRQPSWVVDPSDEQPCSSLRAVLRDEGPMTMKFGRGAPGSDPGAAFFFF